jgi:hypothetical protein
MQSTGSAPEHAPATPHRRKLHPVVWVLICVAGLLLLIAILLTAAGFYIAHRFSEDPVETTATLLSVVDSDLEVVSGNRKNITIREKSTGKSTTINWDDLKGTSVHVGTGGREITIETKERKITLGSGKLPEWLPAYPEARIRRWMNVTGPDGWSGSQTFDTSDGATKVLDFYEQPLKSAGLNVSRSGTAISARNDDGRREITIAADMHDAGARVILSYTARD